MLPSWTRRLRIAVYATHIAITRIRRGWRPTISDPIIVPVAADAGANWRAPLETLGQWLAAEKCAGAEVEIFVSDLYAHYVFIPWSDNVQTKAEVAALAQASVHSLFGDAAANWEIQVDMPVFGAAGIGCALDRMLTQGVRDLCLLHKLRLTVLSPVLLDIFNRWHEQIDEAALIAVVDGSRCVVVSVKDSKWHSVRSLAVGTYASNEIGTLIAREILLQGLAADVPLYLHSQDEDMLRRLRQLRNVVRCGIGTPADIGQAESEVETCEL